MNEKTIIENLKILEGCHRVGTIYFAMSDKRFNTEIIKIKKAADAISLEMKK